MTRRVVIWPIYLDSRVSRGAGRRVPLRLAVDSPTLEELAEAVKALGYSFELDKTARHPAFWYDKPGRLLVVTNDGKTSLVRRVAEEVRRRRARG